MGMLSSSDSDSDSDESKNGQSESEIRSEIRRELESEYWPEDREYQTVVRPEPSYRYTCRSCGFGVNEIVEKCGECGYSGRLGKSDYRQFALVCIALSFLVIPAPLTLPGAAVLYLLSIFSGKGEAPWEEVSRKEYLKEL